jgi:protein-tyrosine sulfotransferase
MTYEPAVLAADATGTAPAAREGVFVLCAGRSGSTLLRYLLDSHPELACPAESLVGQVCRSVHRVWKEVAGAGPPSGPDGRVLARGVVDEVMRQYLAQRGKQVWCEKSLTSVPNLDDITATFPRARYVCLYRHAMDMIASGLEASRWGYGHFGFRSHVERRPENLVAALAEYWADRTQRILELERAGRFATIRLTYEDLVTSPRDALGAVLEFIGVRREAALVDDLVSGSLSHGHSEGLQDYKVGFTSAVHTSSLGGGRTVPIRVLDRTLRERVNELLGELGYTLIDSAWNVGNGPLRKDLADGSEAARHQAEALLGLVARRMNGGPRPVPSAALRIADPAGGLSYLDLATARISRARPDGHPAIWATNSTVLRQLIHGQLDIAHAVRWHLMRRLGPDGGPASAGRAVRLEEQFLGLIFAPPRGSAAD